MGLDTTHNCWHGSYSSFNRFRYTLAKNLGINLDEYIGFHASGTKNLEDIEHDLMPLFNHSDCDGELSVAEQKRIVKGLNDVLDKFNGPSEEAFYMREKIIQFRDGCLDAISKNEAVEFH